MQQTKQSQLTQEALAICEILGETEQAPCHAIYGVVEAVGAEAAWKFASWAVQLHDTHGGMMLPSGAKMRKGAIFLHYAYEYGGMPGGPWRIGTDEKQSRAVKDEEVAVFTLTLPFLQEYANYLRQIEEQTGVSHMLELAIPLNSGRTVVPGIAVVKEQGDAQ